VPRTRAGPLLGNWAAPGAARLPTSSARRPGPRAGPFLDLRSPLGIAPAALPAAPTPPPAAAADVPGAPADGGRPAAQGQVEGSQAALAASHAAYERFADARAKLLARVSARLLQSEAVDFRRLWTDRGVRGAPPGGLSLWRPVPPAGYAALGAAVAPPCDLALERDARDVPCWGACA